MMSFSVKYNSYKTAADNALHEYLPDPGGSIVSKAMIYGVTGGGKRLRPVLLLASAEAFGGDVSTALPFSAALEMIHAYSLIHDDLPAMDNDDYRRGRPSCHKEFDEATAILAGDGLLNLAFETMVKSICGCADCGVINRLAKAAAIIADAAGINGMIAGQSADMQNSNHNEEALLYINKKKTGALISAALHAGAVLGGADGQNAMRFSKAGLKVGTAFQIRDDVLDFEGNFETLGKLTGSDEKNNKTTYAALLGTDECNARIDALTTEAVDLFDASGADAGFLKTLVKRLTTRNS